jgi:hypothetical protein
MSKFAQLAWSIGPPPLAVVMVFIVGYLVVGVPVHFLRGPCSRDVIGSLAGIFGALAYMALVFGFSTNLHGTHG